MRERAEMAGGRFPLESRPGAGVVVKVGFDLPPAA
jgi:signal transduction histidine kinase